MPNGHGSPQPPAPPPPLKPAQAHYPAAMPLPPPDPTPDEWAIAVTRYLNWLGTPAGQKEEQRWVDALNAGFGDPKSNAFEDAVNTVLDKANGDLSRVTEESYDLYKRSINIDPVFGSGQTKGSITELLNPPDNYVLAATGTVQFSDKNGSDTHTATIGSLHSLPGATSADVTVESLGTTGVVKWTYSVLASSIEYLAAGQTQSETVYLTVSDQYDGFNSIPITLSVVGTNDDPTITGGDIGAVISAGGQTTGVLSFSDPDLIDTHQAAATGEGSTLGSLTVGVTRDSTTATLIPQTGALTWTYTVDPSVLAAIPAGETRTDKFMIAVADNNLGVSAGQEITITLKGPDGAGGGGGSSPPPPNIPPGHIVTLDIFTDPVLHDFNGDGAVETPIYIHNAEYYTFDVTNAFSGQYQWAYGGPTDDYDLIVYGPTETFGGLSFPSWEIEAYLESPDFGATRLQTATDAYAIATQDSDPPARGAEFGFEVEHLEYHFVGNSIVQGPTSFEQLNVYTDNAGIPSPYDVKYTTITNGSQVFTYASEKLLWYTPPWDFVVPDGATVVPTGRDVIGML